MCGIFGINDSNESFVDSASRCIRHRGPDSYGKWIGGDFSFGFNRLAIIDLDTRANQPMWDEAHEIGIIFNGEIYNFKALRTELEKEYAFKTTSDTEVLIYAYKKFGPQFASMLNGMFALAIYDTAQKQVLLFRDHAGIKPLLYFYDGTTFIFASEMKAVAAALGEKKITLEYDTDAIRSYFGLGYILSPRTMYEKVQKVPRGSYLVFDIEQKKIISIAPYIAPKATATTDNELHAIIERSVLDHLIADVPVGVFFSGGTDSSLIAAILHAHNINLETFSIAVEGRDSDKPYFSEISTLLGITAHEYAFTAETFADVYETVMKNTDEPCADISIFPTYFVSKKASERVKVVLSGEGGDELFFGYNRQRPLAGARTGSMRAELSLIERLFLMLPTFKGKNFVFENLFALLGQPVAVYLLSMSPSRDLTDTAAWLSAKRALVGASHDPLYFDRDLYLENDLLRKGDLATSLASIEGRVPLLDSRIIAAAPAFENAYTDSGESKPVLKRLLTRYLPHHLVYRPKSGFGIPFSRLLAQSETVKKELEDAIVNLTAQKLLFARLPKTRSELMDRYPNLCFAIICLNRAIQNNASHAGK